MDIPVVQLPLDLTGTNPNNLIGSEEHLLVNLDGFPYKIITMFHGGFYTRGLKVYDANLKKLRPNVDYICTYRHKQLSDRTGLEICSAIVFINHALTGTVTLSAQMVGSDLAFSFSVVQDYINFYNATPGMVPEWADFDGTEPIWGPGELVQKRWGLDTYQPMNNELENISRRLLVGPVQAEDDLRQKVRDRLEQFLGRFNDRLDRHIADKANPHASNPEKVGLGLLKNYRLATLPEAQIFSSNELYLTPSTAWSVSDIFTKPLYDHIALRPADPHDLTFTQLNAHSREQANEILANKQPKGSVIENANTISYRGLWYDYNSYVAALRKDLGTVLFPTGMLNPAKLATGPMSDTSVYRGERRWSRVTDIISEYVQDSGSAYHYMSFNTTDANAVTAYLSATFPFDPIGSFSITQYLTGVGQGYGNGAVWYNTGTTVIHIMSPSGWVQV